MKIRKNVESIEKDGLIAAINMACNSMHHFDAIGSKIWLLIEAEEITVDSLHQELASFFVAEDANQVKSDLLEFLNTCLDMNLISADIPTADNVQPLSHGIDDEERLCMNCGLCCTGMIFHHVVLDEPHPVAFKAEQEHAIERHGDEQWLQLPCVFHVDNRCAIYYDGQPKNCAGFRCRVLKNLYKRSIDFEQALEHIQNAKHAQEKLNTAIKEFAPQLKGCSIFEIKEYIKSHPSERLQSLTSRTIDLALYLKKHFN